MEPWAPVAVGHFAMPHIKLTRAASELHLDLQSATNAVIVQQRWPNFVQVGQVFCFVYKFLTFFDKWIRTAVWGLGIVLYHIVSSYCRNACFGWVKSRSRTTAPCDPGRDQVTTTRRCGHLQAAWSPTVVSGCRCPVITVLHMLHMLHWDTLRYDWLDATSADIWSEWMRLCDLSPQAVQHGAKENEKATFHVPYLKGWMIIQLWSKRGYTSSSSARTFARGQSQSVTTTPWGLPGGNAMFLEVCLMML